MSETSGNKKASAQHVLKTWPEPFAAVLAGLKTAELRVNDRGFEVGDELLLAEFDPSTGRFSGRTVARTVSHIQTGFSMMPGHVCLSFAVKG